MAYAHNPSSQEAETGDYEFETSLGYVERLVFLTHTKVKTLK